MLITALLLFACKENLKNTESTESPEQSVVDDTEFCYLFSSEKDTVMAHLFIKDNSVKGFLDYMFFEKDQNNGTVDGILKGDTIIAEYKFVSEGTESVREIAFLRSNNGIIEGYADVKEKDGKMVFKNVSSLKFESPIVLKKVDCSQLSK